MTIRHKILISYVILIVVSVFVFFINVKFVTPSRIMTELTKEDSSFNVTQRGTHFISIYNVKDTKVTWVKSKTRHEKVYYSEEELDDIRLCSYQIRDSEGKRVKTSKVSNQGSWVYDRKHLVSFSAENTGTYTLIYPKNDPSCELELDFFETGKTLSLGIKILLLVTIVVGFVPVAFACRLRILKSADGTITFQIDDE